MRKPFANVVQYWPCYPLTCVKSYVSLYSTFPISVFLALFPSDSLPCRSVPQQGPVGRSWHSFTPVSPDHIFLFGGFTTDRETLSESDICSGAANNPSLLQNDCWSQESIMSFRWCLAVLREQKRMEAFQTQSHRETEVILSSYCEH